MYKNGMLEVPNEPVRNYKDSPVLKQLLKAADEVCPGLKRYTIPDLIVEGMTVHLVIDGATDEQCECIGEKLDANYKMNVDEDIPDMPVYVSPLQLADPGRLTPC